MLYFVRDASGTILVDVTTDRPADAVGLVENRNDFRTFEYAQAVAEAATELTGKLHIATDAGPYCSPRYDVIRMHAVGDEVSFSFNGDSYPFGKITRISPTMNVITAQDGTRTRRFHRVGDTGSWRSDGTWFLTRGHVSKMNPSF